MSSIFLISRLEYILRRPSLASAMTCAPSTVSAIIALTAFDTSGSAIALMRCASERNRKCIDITPACGESVAAFADEEMQNSTSPDFTSCRTCGSCPSCAPGYWSISMVPLLNSFSLRSEEHTSELQSHVNLVCRLLLEKKKKKIRRVLFGKKEKNKKKKIK